MDEFFTLNIKKAEADICLIVNQLNLDRQNTESEWGPGYNFARRMDTEGVILIK